MVRSCVMRCLCVVRSLYDEKFMCGEKLCVVRSYV